MSAQLFDAQRRIGEELLAASWHASSIAIAAKPGSAWLLLDPSRRVRVRMCSDLANVVAEASTTHPASGQKSPSWTLTVHNAPVTAVIRALLAAPHGYVGAFGRNERAIAGALTAAGMRPDRRRLARVLSGTSDWFSPDHIAEATWTAPYRSCAGGWQLLTSTVHVDATPGIPASVLAPLIAAVAPATGGGSDCDRPNAASHD